MCVVIHNLILNKKKKQWLGGLIDGDGCFLLSQKGYGSLEITMDIRDSYCLYWIKNIFGGSVRLRSGSKSIRYRLHHKKGLLFLLNSVNGYLLHSTRILQLNRLLYKYKIIYIETPSLVFNNGWLSGFFDADGTITINFNNLQLSISISQKTKDLLEIIKNIYGGEIYIDRNSMTYKWCITSKSDVLNLLKYFKIYVPKSKKKNRLLLISSFYDLKWKKNIYDDHLFLKSLTTFKNKWLLYE